MKLYKQITKKQAGVIYRAYKEGKVDIDENGIRSLYNTAEYNGYNDNGTIQRMNDRFALAIEKIFENDYEAANEQIRMALA